MKKSIASAVLVLVAALLSGCAGDPNKKWMGYRTDTWVGERALITVQDGGVLMPLDQARAIREIDGKLYLTPY